MSFWNVLITRCGLSVCYLPRSHCNTPRVVSVGGYLLHHAADSGNRQRCEDAPTHTHTHGTCVVSAGSYVLFTLRHKNTFLSIKKRRMSEVSEVVLVKAIDAKGFFNPEIHLNSEIIPDCSEHLFGSSAGKFTLSQTLCVSVADGWNGISDHRTDRRV